MIFILLLVLMVTNVLILSIAKSHEKQFFSILNIFFLISFLLLKENINHKVTGMDFLFSITFIFIFLIIVKFIFDYYKEI